MSDLDRIVVEKPLQDLAKLNERFDSYPAPCRSKLKAAGVNEGAPYLKGLRRSLNISHVRACKPSPRNDGSGWASLNGPMMNLRQAFRRQRTACPRDCHFRGIVHRTRDNVRKKCLTRCTDREGPGLGNTEIPPRTGLRMISGTKWPDRLRLCLNQRCEACRKQQESSYGISSRLVHPTLRLWAAIWALGIANRIVRWAASFLNVREQPSALRREHKRPR